MKEENKLALVVGYYLSKFDDIAYQNLGYGTNKKTHDAIGTHLDVNPNTIKNMRDEFDAIHDNDRVGWYQRELSVSREDVVTKYSHFDEPELRAHIHVIVNPTEGNHEYFNDAEKIEILEKDRGLIEGEIVERKVMSYKRNAKNTKACKERDKYTCQSCGFWHDNKIVECHHLEPLHMKKMATVALDSLITLCPTCHRLAHNLLSQNLEYYSQKENLLRELKVIR